MKKRLLCCLLALVAFFTFVCTGVSEGEDAEVKLLCLNIGKADCMLLMYGEHYYLIDAGYSQNYPALLLAFQEFGITRLDGVFLTHCHEDHQGGLMLLAQSDMQVDTWYAARIYYDQKPDKHPMTLAAAFRGEKVTWLDAGMEIPVGDDAAFTVLGPLTANTDNENNNSLVMRFSSPAGSILLTGDMKEEEEMELLSAGLISSCDFLKVGHHGDNKATSKALLSAVQPKAAVILTSTAEEPDTPDASTVKQLSQIGCAVYVSQEARDAWLFTIKNGKTEAADIAWTDAPEKTNLLSLTIDMSQDTLTIHNQNDAALSIKDYVVYSTKGNELLTLPEVSIQPGGSYVIGSKATAIATDCVWNDKRVWNEKKTDMAILYDACGRPVACTDNGIAE